MYENMESYKSTAIHTPSPITNGSKIFLDRDKSVCIIVNNRFYWFQKKMFKLCFGLIVEDYTEKKCYRNWR